MRLTRRQVLKLAAANGVLLSLPSAAFAAARVPTGDGFVAAARIGDELAVAFPTRVDFYSTETGRRTGKVTVPAPLVLDAAAVSEDVLHVGGHLFEAGPPTKVSVGDYRKIIEDSGEPEEFYADFGKGSFVATEDVMIPWTATARPGDATLTDVTRLDDRRGMVSGFTPNADGPTVWVAECPEAAVFSATAIRALRGPGGDEITALSLDSAGMQVSSVLTLGDGTTAIVASSDHGMARVWEVTGDTRRELRLPDEHDVRSVVQVLLTEDGYHIVTADHEDGAMRRYRRSGSRWSEVDADDRRFSLAGGLELELPGS